MVILVEKFFGECWEKNWGGGVLSDYFRVSRYLVYIEIFFVRYFIFFVFTYLGFLSMFGGFRYN